MNRLAPGALVLLGLVAVAVAVSACATAGADPGAGSGPSPYVLAGAYDVALTVGDQEFTGALSLRTAADGRVTGSMRIVAPLRIDGSARGRIIDDLLRVTITYTGAEGCDSRIEGILTVERGADTVAGPVTVHDCGEAIAGRLRATR